MRAEPRFIPAFMLLLSGFVAWTAHFLLIYGYTGLLCARPEWARTTMGGIGIIPLGVAALTVATLAALALVLARHGLLRPPSQAAETLTELPFYRQLTQGSAILGSIGIIWQGALSIMMVPSCA
jgi:hypothetical protein